MNPIKGSLRYPAVTLSLTLGLLLAGTQAILHMPRMEDPSVTIRTGIVAALYRGATSDQVESQVAKKIEDRLLHRWIAALRRSDRPLDHVSIFVAHRVAGREISSVNREAGNRFPHRAGEGFKREIAIPSVFFR